MCYTRTLHEGSKGVKLFHPPFLAPASNIIFRAMFAWVAALFLWMAGIDRQPASLI
jgi:hypothetical protein